MLGRRTSAVFSISATRRICDKTCQFTAQTQSGEMPAHLNRTETSAVTSSHVLVASVNGVGARELAELLVHVVSTGARVVTEPDAEVLDLEGLLLADLLWERMGQGQYASLLHSLFLLLLSLAVYPNLSQVPSSALRGSPTLSLCTPTLDNPTERDVAAQLGRGRRGE
jgi:hypothetical protein